MGDGLLLVANRCFEPRKASGRCLPCPTWIGLTMGGACRRHGAPHGAKRLAASLRADTDQSPNRDFPLVPP